MANFFSDRTNKSGDLAGTWTFTNASATVSGSGGNAQTLGLGAGDYIKPTGTDEWYKIASVATEDSITLTYIFAQATQTSVVGNYSDVSVNDGTTAGKAFVKISQFSTDLVRSAGDKLYVRRNQTNLHNSIHIVFDENGTVASPIEVVGDDGTGWAGDTDVRPTISFTTTGFYFDASKNYWNFRRIIFNGGVASYGSISIGGNYAWFYNCVIQNCTGGAYGVTFLFNGGNYYFENCDWVGNSNNAVNNFQGQYAKLVNCTWNGNGNCVAGQGVGSFCELVNCTFGNSSANSGFNLSCGTMARASTKHCTFETGATKITVTGAMGEIYSEDHSGVKGDHRTWTYQGIITKDTETLRTGGATSSAKVSPNSNVSGVIPYSFIPYEVCCYAPASAKTYTVYVLANGWSTNLPSNTECYLEVEYFDESGTAHKTTSVSTNTISANDSWTALSATVTPVADGLLKLRLYLKKYIANASLYVDIKPVVS